MTKNTHTMKICFSPAYSGHVYLAPAEASGAMMDSVVLNTIGLVNFLELRLGLHCEAVVPHERTARYFAAMKQYVDKNPDCILAASFRTAGLSTAIAVLAWRDRLRAAGWDFSLSAASPRLECLMGIEAYFDGNGADDLVDRLRAVVALLDAGNLDCSAMEIAVPVDVSLFRPAEQELLAAMERQGARIVRQTEAQSTGSNLSRVRTMIMEGSSEPLTADEDDDSLLIYKFPDEHAACEYLAYHEMADVDVWINADNKEMDDCLGKMRRPLTGSAIADCAPRLMQLFILGVSLYVEPLDINALIEWLNTPIHPLSAYFRRQLAQRIAREGGYRNEACRDIVKKYIEGSFEYLDEEERKLPEAEQQKLRMKDMKKRSRLVTLYLPASERQEQIEVERLKAFGVAFSAWCRQRVHLEKEKDAEACALDELLTAADMSDAFLLLLNTESVTYIDAKTLDSWISTIYAGRDIPYKPADRNSRLVVDAPGKLISVANTTVWMGVEGDDASRLECSFLYPSEREMLGTSASFQPWDERMETRYHEMMGRMALTKTAQHLILVVCEQRAGEPTQKHPLLVRLEQQVTNFQSLVRYPEFEASDFEPATRPVHTHPTGEVSILHADGLAWPDHLSPTNVSRLVEYPLDYVMQDLVGITAAGKAAMDDVKRTKGNVAHAVIAALFAPDEENGVANAEEIAARCRDSYETVYAQTIEGNGAVLLLPENRLEEKLLHAQLRTCIEHLLDILRANRLVVTGCEQAAAADMHFGLPRPEDEDGNGTYCDMQGRIDMTLQDEAGMPIVVDFKWTSSRNYYQSLLEENRSVQLALYGHLLSLAAERHVQRVAYFLMPEGQLFSTSEFAGNHCIRLTPKNHDDIVQQTGNSVRYRKAQISQGRIETNTTFDALEYVKDTPEQNLYPLRMNEETHIKEENPFSDYMLFYI